MQNLPTPLCAALLACAFSSLQAQVHPSSGQHPPIKGPRTHYVVSKPYALGKLGATLKVTQGGRTRTIIRASKDPDRWMSIESEGDFDGNGTLDALVLNSPSGGGNAGGESYFFVSQDRPGHFSISQPFGTEGTASLLRIEPWGSHLSVLTSTTLEGFGNTDLFCKVTRTILDGHEAVEVDSHEYREMPAPINLRSSDLLKGDTFTSRTFQVPLSSTNRPWLVLCEPWERWERMMVSLVSPEGNAFKLDASPKRLGVLEHRTQGMHDLVCDFDEVYTWNHDHYEAAKPVDPATHLQKKPPRR